MRPGYTKRIQINIWSRVTQREPVDLAPGNRAHEYRNACKSESGNNEAHLETYSLIAFPPLKQTDKFLESYKAGSTLRSWHSTG